MHGPGDRCQGEEWSYSFCCWVENGENTCLSAVFCSAVTCFSELLQGATFCCFSSLCFLWQLPKCCIKTASGELRWHGELLPWWCWLKCSQKKPGRKSYWNCLALHENHLERRDGNNFRKVCLELRLVAGLKENEKGVCLKIFQTQTKPRLPLACCKLDQFLLLVKADKEIVSQRWWTLLHVRAAGRWGWWELDLQEPAEKRWLAFSLTFVISAAVPAPGPCWGPAPAGSHRWGRRRGAAQKPRCSTTLPSFSRVRTVKSDSNQLGKPLISPLGNTEVLTVLCVGKSCWCFL